MTHQVEATENLQKRQQWRAFLEVLIQVANRRLLTLKHVMRAHVDTSLVFDTLRQIEYKFFI